jgi:molybdopterin-guanine dinucleotide biosynthesis protein A
VNLPYGLIIAGGKGSRLGGVRKGDLRVGGVRLIDRVAGSLGAVAPPLLVATGPGRYRGGLPKGAVALTDAEKDHQGPLAALVAAVTWLEAHGVVDGVLLSASVDTPLLPPHYASRLIGALADAPAAYAAWGDDFYPTNAAWRIEALRALPGWLTQPDAPNSPNAVLRRLGGAPVNWQAAGGENSFANVNSVSDLLALQRLMRG